MGVKVEICVDDVAGAVAAERCGADRIELCAALSEGGLTPSFGLVETVLGRLRRIGVQVMIRPRGGDFTVDADERDVMLADIAALRRLAEAYEGEVGFVFGALGRQGGLDEPVLRDLKAACGSAPTTFHKAFDRMREPMVGLARIAALGFDRILTSGGADTAVEGAASLRALVERAGDRPVILAGGGVRAHNARDVVARTGVAEIHLRAMRPQPGRPPVTSADDIAAVVAAVRDSG